MMLNPEMGMIWVQNKPLAKCYADSAANTPEGPSGRLQRNKDRNECRNKFAGH